jgi:hypothetical protein
MVDYEHPFSVLGLTRPARFASEDDESTYRLEFLDPVPRSTRTLSSRPRRRSMFA